MQVMNLIIWMVIKDFFQEAFRNLYISIRFSDTQDEIKAILLTSSLPKEGKTLTNILLAKKLYLIKELKLY